MRSKRETSKPSPKRKFWHEAFDVAEKRYAAGARGRDVFTEPWIDMAADWPTCACGTGDPRIPRTELGVPFDYQLSELGVLFVGTVASGNVGGARKIMRDIDQRETEVLRKMGILK